MHPRLLRISTLCGIYCANLASFTPTIHLSVSSLAVDSRISPTCMHVQIKASKTDLFRKGSFVHIGRGKAPLCALLCMLAYLSMQSNTPGPLFLLSNGQPVSSSPDQLITTDLVDLWLELTATSPAIVFGLTQPQSLPETVSLTTSFRLSGVGQAMHINCTSGPPWKPWPAFPVP